MRPIRPLVYTLRVMRVNKSTRTRHESEALLDCHCGGRADTIHVGVDKIGRNTAPDDCDEIQSAIYSRLIGADLFTDHAGPTNNLGRTLETMHTITKLA